MSAAGITESMRWSWRCEDILLLKVWEFGHNLLGRQARGQQIDEVGHPDTHAPYTGAPPHCLGLTVIRSASCPMASS
jgi:hypothetical protein